MIRSNYVYLIAGLFALKWLAHFDVPSRTWHWFERTEAQPIIYGRTTINSFTLMKYTKNISKENSIFSTTLIWMTIQQSTWQFSWFQWHYKAKTSRRQFKLINALQEILNTNMRKILQWNLRKLLQFDHF